MNEVPSVELHIYSADGSQYMREIIEQNQFLHFGRAPMNGCTIPWDPMISREHADVCWDGSHLRVTCRDSARNPIMIGQTPHRDLLVSLGQHFIVGATRFHVVEPGGKVEEVNSKSIQFDVAEGNLSHEHSFSPEQLKRVAFGDTDRQLEVLSSLPRLISASQTDDELASLLSTLLLEAISGAECVAVAQFDADKLPTEDESADALPAPLMLNVDTRDGFQGRFRPSRRLLLKALRQQETVAHVLDSIGGSEEFTMLGGLGWAFCTPILGESCRGWCLYVSGKSDTYDTSVDALQGEMRFTQLVTQFISSIRQVRLLQEQKTQLSTFFSPKVIENLTGDDRGNVLEPAERDVSVLFCDVRGFSRKSESMANDLHSLLKSVSAALGVMSNAILDQDGTIADFQGDAALGFWGWPVELEDGPLPACRAALDIYRGFLAGATDQTSLLHGFSIGIGIVHGRAIAGQIGTSKQAKVGVFGPKVNQGARLEGLTKQFGVSICIDDMTAEWVKRRMPREEGRIRRLARVRPQGMDKPLEVYQLVLPEADTGLSDSMISSYETALGCVIDGRWDEARKLLEEGAEVDIPRRFLLKQLARSDYKAPQNWDGAFTLTRK